MARDFKTEGNLIAESGKLGTSETNLHTIPTGNDTLTVNNATQTLQNKTLDTSNTINTTPSGNLSSTTLNSALAELQIDVDSRIATSQLGSTVAPLVGGLVPLANMDPSLLDSAVYTTFTASGEIALQTGTLRWYPPRSITFNTWEAWVSTVPTGAAINCRIKKNDVIQGDLIIIADGQNRGSGNIGTPWVANVGDYITVDIDQVGSTFAGADLNIRLGGV